MALTVRSDEPKDLFRLLEAIVPMILSPPKESVEHLVKAIRTARRNDSDHS